MNCNPHNRALLTVLISAFTLFGTANAETPLSVPRFMYDSFYENHSLEQLYALLSDPAKCHQWNDFAYQIRKRGYSTESTTHLINYIEYAQIPEDVTDWERRNILSWRIYALGHLRFTGGSLAEELLLKAYHSPQDMNICKESLALVASKEGWNIHSHRSPYIEPDFPLLNIKLEIKRLGLVGILSMDYTKYTDMVNAEFDHLRKNFISVASDGDPNQEGDYTSEKRKLEYMLLNYAHELILSEIRHRLQIENFEYKKPEHSKLYHSIEEKYLQGTRLRRSSYSNSDEISRAP